MRLVADGTVYRGRAIDLRSVTVDGEPLDGATILEAIRAPEASSGPVRVDCPDPTRAHDRLGHVDGAADRSLRALLAAAARSRGRRAPQRSELCEARAELADRRVPDFDLTDLRRRAASAGRDAAALRERVAELRGRLRAFEEIDAETAPVERDLRTTVGRLSEVETERIAAVQALSAAERRAREARTKRERRLELEDRVANLERAARAHLAAAVYGDFAAAARELPGEVDPGGDPGAFDGDAVTAHLAAVRIADLAAPVVLSVDRFDDADEAAARLDAAVVLL
ncbi:DUF7856 family protein [Halegenticoccus tardaugens]|uniref:DUF7856 family protein n=1 Tax=Halegenticoccus tardaugens TaxID=2071624 RepID=UPI00100BBBAC|nr:hypothetical protein [Halegenticoccus tardaugens]